MPPTSTFIDVLLFTEVITPDMLAAECRQALVMEGIGAHWVFWGNKLGQ